MVHYGFRSKEAKRAIKQKYLLRQTTSHSSLLLARHGDVTVKRNQAFLLADSFNFNFVDEERSDIHNAVCLCNYFFPFFLPLIFANTFCFHPLSWVIDTLFVYLIYYFESCTVFLICCSS